MNPSLAEELFVLYTLNDPYLRPHTFAVAERISGLSGRIEPKQRRVALSLAFLHDIGKSERLCSSGFHPLDGSTVALLRGEIQLAALICHHSGARFEARRRFIDLPYPLPSTPVLDLLDVVDATTLPSGQTCTLDERGQDISRRYGSHSPPALAFYDFLPQLELKARALGLA